VTLNKPSHMLPVTYIGITSLRIAFHCCNGCALCLHVSLNYILPSKHRTKNVVIQHFNQLEPFFFSLVSYLTCKSGITCIHTPHVHCAHTHTYKCKVLKCYASTAQNPEARTSTHLLEDYAPSVGT